MGKKQKQEHEQALTTARSDFGSTLEQEKGIHLQEVDKINAENAQEVDKLRDEMEQLQSKGGSFLLHHTEAVKQLKADNAEAMKALKAKHAKSLESMQRERQVEDDAREKRYTELQTRYEAAFGTAEKERQKVERLLAEKNSMEETISHLQDRIKSMQADRHGYLKEHM